MKKKPMTEAEWAILDKKNAAERQELVRERIRLDIAAGKYKVEDFYHHTGTSGTSGTSRTYDHPDEDYPGQASGH